MADWNARWMAMAEHVATWSKDRSTKVGCVVVGSANQVLSLGYNGFPRNVDDDVWRPGTSGRIKYQWTEHAERNAIYNACRQRHVTGELDHLHPVVPVRRLRSGDHPGGHLERRGDPACAWRQP